MSSYQVLMRDAALDRVDANVLMRHVTGTNRAWLIAHGDDEATPAHEEAFAALAARRRNGEPVAYLVGTREFFGRDFAVDPAVLIPRPETELLVELALARAGQGERVVDLGTGSGCIPVTIKLERPDLVVSAVDISTDALAVARGNAAQLGADVVFHQSDWYTALTGQTFDVIVSNPPYIVAGDAHLVQGDLRFEPQGALTDFADGLKHVRIIVAGAREHLAPHGYLLFEHGFDQGPASRALLADAGFVEVKTWTDLAGLDRVSGGRLA
ncbi:peptide chain release factor N(5)-glutamine methyltransferase [Jeongeupia wiesaeckerbachi]|uniref:peptide chain release factor N(5)-glutamine methyltransferase n=1 Tax=Jeongeupia wiesaeckerbachi TaxID=3051218 RepID=UPI003D805E68